MLFRSGGGRNGRATSRALAHLQRLARAITTHDPRTRLLSNADGNVVQSGADYLARLVKQVANPVRWDLCMQTMADLGVTGLLELPPSGTLTGIAKRNLKGVELFSLNTPDQIPAAREFVAKHGEAGSTSAMSNTPSWMLVVSPGKGTFHRAPNAGADAVLAPDSVIGTVDTLRNSTSVSTPHGGTVVEWLAEDGDPVAPGQPLVRLYPAADSIGGSAS